MKTPRLLPTLRRPALALAVLGLVAGLATVAEADGTKHGKLRLVVGSGAERDTVEISELGEIAVGDSRSATTENGRPVTVTRQKNGYLIDVDGKEVRVADDPVWLDEDEDSTFRMQRIEISGEGGGEHRFVISNAPGEKRMIVRRNANGEHGSAYSFGGAMLPALGVDSLLALIERGSRFQELDDTTRQIVRDVVREALAAPVADSPEEDGKGERFEVWIDSDSSSEPSHPQQ